MSRIRSFKDLEVWKRGMILVREVYGATDGYPAEERYGLAAETRKTARSIPANVAEGKMRFTPRDFRKFVGIALGSAGELQTQLCMAADLGYLPPLALEKFEAALEELQRMLRSLERSLALASPA
jgi:four helix bundle protein